MRPNKLAPCPLLAELSGVDVRRDRWTVRTEQMVMCDRPFDCKTCPLFQDHVMEMSSGYPERVVWACFQCLDVEAGVFLGFYSSGVCSFCGQSRSILSSLLLEFSLSELEMLKE